MDRTATTSSTCPMSSAYRLPHASSRRFRLRPRIRSVKVMKHVRYAEKSLLMGDEVVDLMMEYAVLLARQSSADSINVEAIGTDGDTVTATFLIGPATIMV